jgi:hypothetical protein
MHAPPQDPVDGHVMVGVHVEPDGQLACGPKVQGTGEDEVGETTQVPVQTDVKVHVWLG